MASNTQEEPKPDGAAFDDFFESLGKKAENLTTNDKNGATAAPGNDEFEATENDDGEPKIVDEIESLCMNCHENVRLQICKKFAVNKY